MFCSLFHWERVRVRAYGRPHNNLFRVRLSLTPKKTNDNQPVCCAPSHLPSPSGRGGVILSFQQILHYKPNVRGSFCETAHEIRIPVLPIGNVNPHSPAVPRQLLLQIATDAVKHLKLKGVFGNPLRCANRSSRQSSSDHELQCRGKCRWKATAA